MAITPVIIKKLENAPTTHEERYALYCGEKEVARGNLHAINLVLTINYNAKTLGFSK